MEAGLADQLSVCPDCGAQRIGQFRYCRLCGLDFDLVERRELDAGRGRTTAAGSQSLWAASGTGYPSSTLAESDDGDGRGQFSPSRTTLLWVAVAIGVVSAALVWIAFH